MTRTQVSDPGPMGPLVVFNGIIQTISVAFSLKMSRACTGMSSSENDDFIFLKTVNNIKIMCTIVPGLVEMFYNSKPVRR